MGARHQQTFRHRPYRIPNAATADQVERPLVSRPDRRAPRGACGGRGEMTRVTASPTAALRALQLAPGTVALWWLGQAGFAVRAGGLVMLLDPFLAPMAERASPPAFGPEDPGAVHSGTCSHEHLAHRDLAALPPTSHRS